MNSILFIIAISCLAAFAMLPKNRKGGRVDNRQGRQTRGESSHHHPSTAEASSGNTDETETQFWRGYFALYCTSSTGKMDANQLYDAFKSWNFVGFSREFVQQVLQKYDVDNDGFLDFDEFLQMELVIRSIDMGETFDECARNTGNVLTAKGFMKAVAQVRGHEWQNQHGYTSVAKAKQDMNAIDHEQGPTLTRLQFLKYILGGGNGMFDYTAEIDPDDE